MRIVFTSCMDAVRVPQQPVWRRIAQQQPDVLVLLGDHIYMDWGLSLGSEPRWKRIFGKPVGPEAFAEEMHGRYQQQWQVAEFRALIADFVATRGRERLLLTWDDHDFAWNNAVGEDAVDPHGVPARARSISRRLFMQFYTQLRDHPGEAQYPPAPARLTDGPDETEGVAQRTSLDGVDFLLLDTRFHRTGRAGASCHLLGAEGSAQRQLLRDTLAAGQGVLVLAGGSPMRSKYLFSDQGWHGPDTSYPEYQELIDAARARGRPVLYLGGDIHRNAWGGRLGGDDSQVVQVLASGAALGRILVKRFAPSFGVLALDPARRQVGVSLCEMDPAGRWLASDVGTLGYGPQGWLPGTVPQTDEFDDGYRYAGVSVDDPDVAVLCYRARKLGLPIGQPQSFLMEELDGVYGDRLPAGNTGDPPYWPEPVALSVQAGDRLHLQLTRGDSSAAGCAGLMRAAFERALLAGKKSVVLYIHGFNKTFAASVDQACGLKERYPQVEPVLLSWPSGEDGGLLKMLGELAEAEQHAQALWRPLAGVFSLFGQLANEARYRGLRKVVLARSLGAEALAGLFGGDAGLAQNIAAAWGDQVSRVILSAPAARSSHHARWMDRIACQTVVTFNVNDHTLKPASWVRWGSALLGNSAPAEPAARALYIDCTRSPAVLGSHDYLLLDLNPGLTELNRRLLTGEPVDTAQLPAGFHAVDGQQVVADAAA